MEKQKALLALKQVASRNGVPLAEVIREIDLAIAAAMQSEDPDLRAQWARIPTEGDVPTAIVVVAYLARRLEAGPPSLAAGEGLFTTLPPVS